MLKCIADGCSKSVPQPMNVKPGGKLVGATADRGQRILQRQGGRRRVDFDERRERRREHAVLEEVALAGERVVEDAPRGAQARAAGARRIPGQAHARREVVLVRLVGAARHALVARIDQTERRLREPRRLLAGAERVERVVRVDERHRHLVAHAEVQRHVRARPELVLDVAAVDPAVTVLRSIRPSCAGTAPEDRAGSRRRRCR